MVFRHDWRSRRRQSVDILGRRRFRNIWWQLRSWKSSSVDAASSDRRDRYKRRWKRIYIRNSQLHRKSEYGNVPTVVHARNSLFSTFAATPWGSTSRNWSSSPGATRDRFFNEQQRRFDAAASGRWNPQFFCESCSPTTHSSSSPSSSHGNSRIRGRQTKKTKHRE